eukprot:CAMPEP_0181025626 /NCGR_PEP_ID=MMETSP1070-20121207/3201_1 /TAXON_ID=265543 /ORGANISM="Minutocellus polymorphus, Strain NH13" /LENGTH=266 /DNA_ID=CAMNT_0023102753 /DNA_START=12 /DNA_END=812 /DNA_ORIENTATION=+
MIIDGTKPAPAATSRGAFILLEGVDRCGKTTQCALLLKHLLSLSMAAVALRFPDRTTQVGKLIDGYLQSGADLDDRAVHLLFSANRWEAAPSLAQTLAEGSTIVCDRYAYSGVAFSSAKTKEDRKDGATSGGSAAEDLSIDWCKGPDVGLPAPDCVLFLDLSQDEAEKRGGYGGERYEKRDLQIRVRQRFAELQEMDEKQGRVPWHIIDASKTVEEVTADIASVVDATIKRVQEGKPLAKMWDEGDFVLPTVGCSGDDAGDAKGEN